MDLAIMLGLAVGGLVIVLVAITLFAAGRVQRVYAALYERFKSTAQIMESPAIRRLRQRQLELEQWRDDVREDTEMPEEIRAEYLDEITARLMTINMEIAEARAEQKERSSYGAYWI